MGYHIRASTSLRQNLCVYKYEFDNENTGMDWLLQVPDGLAIQAEMHPNATLYVTG